MLISGIGFALLFASVGQPIDGGVASVHLAERPSSGHISQIVAAKPTLAPFQHVRFCLQNPDECKPNASTDDQIKLTTSTMAALNQVNRSVNSSIYPRAKTYGSNLNDAWSLGPATGDCNDYAVTKRHELIALGLPAAAMRLAVVRTSSGMGHLVLTVASDKGDIVMDNLTNAIRPWERTDYQWLKIQSSENPRFWHEISSPAMTASARKAAPSLRLATR